MLARYPGAVGAARPPNDLFLTMDPTIIPVEPIGHVTPPRPPRPPTRLGDRPGSWSSSTRSRSFLFED